MKRTLLMLTDDVKYLVLHCSATRCDQDYTEEQMMRDHKERHLRTIGYHFYIRKDGSTIHPRQVLEVGAHCIPYNRCSLGICYEGGLDENGLPCDTRTEAQKRRLTDLLNILHQLFPKAKIVGHRDLPGTLPKSCPCFDAQKEYGYINAIATSAS